jgi:hypothetical protein
MRSCEGEHATTAPNELVRIAASAFVPYAIGIGSFAFWRDDKFEKVGLVKWRHHAAACPPERTDT